MVLINTVTVEAINTALIALQRGQSITIGGEKGGTVNNINVTNNGTGSGTDVSPQLNALDKRVTEVENENERQNERIAGLEGLGIESVEFEEGSRILFIYLVNGDVLDVVIPDRPLSLTLNGTTLTLSSDGETLSNVELPFIPSSEKGVAGGVATLDSSGRLPYSQLPESAMEFKGTWNASTNDPHLEDGTGTNGDFYVCTMPGTATFGPGNTVSFIQNDRVIYDGATSKWVKLLAGQVSTVNGMSGDVVLNGTNVNYDATSGSPTLKNKIDAIETMADTQVDWNESNSSSLAYIKNKPSIPAAQVQSDWEQTDSTQKDFIKHKIPIWITQGSASDNMSPVNSVTSGEMRPATSNAVYNFLYNRYIPTGYCTTSGSTQTKVINIFPELSGYQTILVYFQNGNTAAGPINVKINNGTARRLYIDGVETSSTHYTFGSGIYILTRNGESSYYLETSRGINSSRTAISAISANSAGYSSKVVGTYTGSGGQQNPRYVGKARVCFNMMNTTVNGNSQYKDWLMMDCYGGFDVGGTVAFGINRQSLGAYIMRANAGTNPNRPTTWAESAELIHTKNICNLLYPVGAIYITLSSADFSNFLGGTWVKINDGSFIRASGGNAGTVGQVQAEGLPNITGYINNSSGTYGVTGFEASASSFTGAFEGDVFTGYTRTGQSSSHTAAKYLEFNASKGNSTTPDGATSGKIYGNSSHVTPRNIAVYMWKRTA